MIGNSISGRSGRLTSARAWGLVAVALVLAGGVGCVSQGASPGSEGHRSGQSAKEQAAGPGSAEAIEEFLRSAAVVDVKSLGTGVTLSSRITLVQGDVTMRALWKTIDHKARVERFADGTHEMNFEDSYRHEIAAYELDKVLDLGMVPPTVERSVRGRRGCAQLWVENATTFAELVGPGFEDSDAQRWAPQLAKVKIFHLLISDSDWKNYANILVDADGGFHIIDSSRAFRFREELTEEGIPRRFSRALLERLRALTPELLRARLGSWISSDRIEALLVRRDLIIERAEAQVAAYGEAAVLY